MRLSVILFLVCIFVSISSSQTPLVKKKVISFSAGMGISYGSAPDLTEYLRSEIPYSNSDSIAYYNAGIEFFGAFEYEFTNKLSARLDYSYFVRNLSYTYSFFVFDYTISSHQPYVIVNYLFKEPKYALKFGLGAGYHFQQLDNKINPNAVLTYTSSGLGLRGVAEISLLLSKGFYSSFGAFTYGNFYSKLKDSNGNILTSADSTKQAGLGGFGIGLRLGFQFNLN
jgi:hypothetical protein